MAIRPEDRNADQRFEPFEEAATLTELASFLAELRGLGAPGDARPRVKLNEDNEIIGVVCVVKRRPEINEAVERNRR
jgi:hypothetical protein